MEEIPKVSVVVPVHNAERYLDRCVQSILSQTLVGLELILVDDASTDKCPRMCDEWAERDARIRVVHKEKSEGPGPTRNVGIAAASGKYIGFVDSDDWIAPDMYEHLVNLLEQSDADFSGIDYQIATEQIAVIQPRLKVDILDRDQLLERFFRLHMEQMPYSVCDKLYKREVLETMQFCDTLFEDIDYNFQLICRCRKSILSNQIKYFWFYNYGSITRAGVRPVDMQSLRVWERIHSICQEKYPEFEYYARMNYERAFMGILGKSVMFGVSDGYEQWPQDKEYLLRHLRKYFKDLIRWKMPLSRRILLCALCISPEATSIGYKHLKRGGYFTEHIVLVSAKVGSQVYLAPITMLQPGGAA